MNGEEGFSGVEQSWIVLDDNGWVPSSRPATTSPCRGTPKLDDPKTKEHDDDDDEDDEENPLTRRIGMDRDVRVALEMAERSLELVGNLEDLASRRSNRNSSDDDTSTSGSTRASPATKMTVSGSYVGSGNNGFFVDDGIEDRYNGRAPPTIVGNFNRRLTIATDSEHVAFQTIHNNKSLITSSSSSSSFPERKETPILIRTVSPLDSNARNKSDDRSRTYDKKESPQEEQEEQEEGETSFFQWALGLTTSTNFVPLVVSHVVTLVVGFYIGSRRSGNGGGGSASHVVSGHGHGASSPNSAQCSTGTPA